MKCKTCNKEIEIKEQKFKFKHFCNHSCKAKHEWRYGKDISKKISNWNKKRYIDDPELKNRITKKANKKVRELYDTDKANCGFKVGHSTWNKGLNKNNSPIVAELSNNRFGIGNPMHKSKHNNEFWKKISVAKQKYYTDNPEKHPNVIMARKGFVSKPQMEMYLTIKEYFPSAVLEHPVKTREGVKLIDVAVVNKKLAFEFDGSYWHQDKQADTTREEAIVNEGWVVIRFNEDNFNKIEEVIKEI